MPKDKHAINVQLPHSVWPQILEAVEAAKNVPCPHCGQVSHNGNGKYGVSSWIRDVVLAELARLDTEKNKPARKKKSKGGWPKGKPRGPRKKKKKEPEPVIVSKLDDEPMKSIL